MSETAPRADDHDPERMPGAGDDRGGIWHPRYLWVTVGAVAMIFLAATQALAVTTVMPLVSADLGGDALYAVAFSGTLATSVIGMVAVGAWCDRRDPVLPLATFMMMPRTAEHFAAYGKPFFARRAGIAPPHGRRPCVEPHPLGPAILERLGKGLPSLAG